MNSLVLFWLFLKASLFSSGGFGNLPSLHADLTTRHWATERQFAESLMIGQVAPGPNGLWVISLGYLVAGGWGACLAAIGVTLPPLLVLAVERVYRRVQDSPAVQGFMRGLSLAIVGIFGTVLFGLLRSAGSDGRAFAIAAIAFGLGLSRRAPIPLLLALAGAAGVLLR